MTQKKVLVPANEPLLSGREAEYVSDCVRTGWISGAGGYVERFEKEWAAYCGRRYGVAVSSGTAALELAVSVLALPAGGEVLLPAFTIVSCLEAVLRNDLTPVLVDCDPLTYCMDVADARSKITARTVAVMPVHLYGHPVDMEPLIKLCARRRLKIIEDAAEAIGAQCRIGGEWRRCGSFGDMSAFSFYANKNITCGEGGMVLTDNAAAASALRSRRDLCFGADRRYIHADRGWSFRMTNMQASIGCAQLERIARFLERKREVAALYSRGLSGLPLFFPHVEAWARSSVWMYAIRLKDNVPFDALEFSRRLGSEGVDTRPFFFGLHMQPCYGKIGLFAGQSFPVTEAIQSRGLLLPSGQAITDAQVAFVIETVRKTLGSRHNRSRK